MLTMLQTFSRCSSHRARLARPLYQLQCRGIAEKKSSFSKYDLYGGEGHVEGHGMSHFRGAGPGSAAKKPESDKVESEKSKPSQKPLVYDESTYFPPMVNHIWRSEEIEERRKVQPLHTPKNLTDAVAHTLVKKILYRGFNYVSGFNYENPTVKSCQFRLILLESIAGVPGMVAAVFRHFTSLRTLQRDHGWIHTLLEEAQNERMHLLVCLKKFDAGLGTRIAVVLSQYIMVVFLSLSYLIHPRFLHRFVGYLEETAVKTYSDLIRITKTSGTHLNKEWGDDSGKCVPAPAPGLAIAYWKLRENATWEDVLEQLLADESHHRDVNHRFADLDKDAANPFLAEKIKDLNEVVEMRAFKEK
eukprot:TRINITY_DN49714_c0_g1_i1.p1 TRINITY_DN49714_c0_g1~~TRINITY_DN49714_c0_g1_i1.p1  ORF type:complete len:359 (-),score=43.12 TRINITY_DN49714_c0_g1_i1:312-1388(-)